MKMKKLVVLLGTFLLLTLVLAGCGGTKTVKADYTTTQFETALNKGDNLEGKTVSVEVEKLVPNSAFGYNIQAGKHLNFVSTDNPNVKKGDKVILKVTKIQSTLGSYIITYEKQ
jgi:predicted RNA-binding protein with TRAM domain